MSKLMISIILGTLVVVGAGAFYMVNQSADRSTDTPQMSDDTLVQSEMSTLRDLMTNSSDQMCTFTDRESQSNGTVYVSGENTRGDFEVIADGQTMNSHMIRDGMDMYLWMDEEPSGVKMSLSDIDDANIPDTEQVDLDQEVDFSCQPWTVDHEKFTIPDRHFEDMSAMMEGFMGEDAMDVDMMDQMGVDKAEQCASCDSLPPEQAEECRLALSC